MTSWYEDLVRSLNLQPADVATLFSGVRAAVPVYAAFGATGLNEGEDERLRQIYGPRPLPAPPPVSEEEQRRRMIEEFERKFPTPELRQAALQHMRAVRAGAYDPATATRRADFAPQPPGPVMKPIDTPIRRKRYAGGGGVKKTVQQMADEMLVRGTKTATKPDLARRSLLGLRPQSVMDMPIAKLSDAELSKLERQYGKEGLAPTITEREVQVSPDAGKTKSVLKSVTETPVSRRTVLKSAAGQAMQGVLPKGALPVPSAANLAESVVESAAPAAVSPSGIPGLIAAALREGMSEEDTARMILDVYRRADPAKVERAVGSIKDPASLTFEEPVGAGAAMMELIGAEGSPLANRGALRYLRRVAPEKYDELSGTARDISEFGFEP